MVDSVIYILYTRKWVQMSLWATTGLLFLIIGMEYVGLLLENLIPIASCVIERPTPVMVLVYDNGVRYIMTIEMFSRDIATLVHITSEEFANRCIVDINNNIIDSQGFGMINTNGDINYQLEKMRENIDNIHHSSSSDDWSSSSDDWTEIGIIVVVVSLAIFSISLLTIAVVTA